MSKGTFMCATARAAATAALGLGLLVGAGCGDDDPGADSGGPPAVVSTTPAEDSGAVWLHDAFTVTFSQPLDPSTIDADSLGFTGVDGDLDHTATLSDDGLTLTVQVGDDVATFGEVHLALADTITGVDGAALEARTLTWDLAPWAPAPDADDGGDAGAPSIAVEPDGSVLAAWHVLETDGASHVVVQRLGADGWTRLGGPLGDGAAALPSIVVDGDGAPVVVWTEGTDTQGSPDVTIEAASWDGAAWNPLPSPGDGTAAVLATMPGGGDPVVAWISSEEVTTSVAVATLSDGSWEAYETAIQVNGSVVGKPSLSLATATNPVVGIVDKSGVDGSIALRVLGWTGLWNERPAIRLPPPSLAGQEIHLSVAATGSAIYVAWDEDSGHSFSVHVAQASAGGIDGWDLLGGALDIDPPADARSPTLMLDVDGDPIVAWQEQIEANERGFVARWDGVAWVMIGGDSWHPDPSSAPLAPVMALWRERAPLVAWSSGPSTTLALARFNGPASPRFGLATRPANGDCAFDPANPPTKLSLTGCFTVADGRAVPHPSLVPFDLVSELWSDGALKRRWMLVADGAQLTTPSGGAWSAPIGTVLVKEFAIETTPGNPSTRRVMETRFLVIGGSDGSATGVQGFSYQWRVAGDDADLLEDVATTFDWELDDGETHTHTYPSRVQCNRCHNASNGPILGPRTGQLARKLDYGGIAADQLATLEHIGLVTAASGNDLDPFVAPHDPRAPLEQRVRGYLAANCAHCHNPTGERPTRDFRWETPLEGTFLCDVLVPGSTQDSLVYQRVSSRPGMPPLATLQTDPVILDVLEQWIGSIETCP